MEIDRVMRDYPHLVMKDGAGVPAFLAPGKAGLDVRMERYGKIRFHARREYPGPEEEAPAQPEYQ